MGTVIEKAEQAARAVPLRPEADLDLPEPPVEPCSPEEYDVWFRAKVQEALDDPNPIFYSTEEVMASVRAVIERRQREKEERERARS